MDIGAAVKVLKQGGRVRRAHWNGIGMWLAYTPGRMVKAGSFWSLQNQKFAMDQELGEAEVLPYVTMKTADNKIVPWLCSQSDLLSEDWEEVP